MIREPTQAVHAHMWSMYVYKSIIQDVAKGVLLYYLFILCIVMYNTITYLYTFKLGCLLMKEWYDMYLI